MREQRVLTAWVFAVSLAAPGFAQQKPSAGPPPPPGGAPSASAPAPPAPATGTPAAKSPAAPGAASSAANGPAAAGNATAPAGNAPAAAPATAGTPRKLTIRVPSGGQYTAYVQEVGAPPKSFQDKLDLELPAGVTGGTLYVLDQKSGYAARKTVDAKMTDVSLASPDFKLVQKVQVKATGKDDKPIAAGSVTLTDGARNTMRTMIQATSQGVAEFEFVASGAGSVAVAPEGGSATTKEVTFDLPKGESVQTVTVALPEVTATVEPPGGAATGTAAGNAPAANAPAPTAPAPVAAPVQPAQPAQPISHGSDWGGTVIAWIILIALGAAGYVYMKNKGIKIEDLIRKLGVQPDAVAQGGGSLAGANLATGTVAPGAPPGPPPIVADPNQCPFCGQMKDPSGNCACTVAPGAAAPFASPSFSAGPASGGPRLIGVAGAYLGHVFPISGAAVMGREPTNPVALDRDTTASRRHAQITTDGGVYRIQDLGSSNGTFVNGARITDAELRSGDEVAVGGSRFRFEV